LVSLDSRSDLVVSNRPLRCAEPTPSLHVLRSRSSSSRALGFPYRVRIHSSPASNPQIRSTFLGVTLLLRDTRIPSPLTRDHHHVSRTFRPQRFSRSRRLAPWSTLEACFILQPRPRFTLQGVSLMTSRTNSSLAFALMPLLTLAYPAVARLAPVPANSTSRRFSSHQSVATDRVFRSASTRSPLKFSLPRVFLRTPFRHLRAHSAFDVGF
jgi:hypothetical protein